ncbi:hypothetical protein, partial [Paenibacillus taichungensis]|uniref:hypothetical protein n=1 Tax=Paenibacillus taichungensis TaxID=484184 RepID=UPI002871F748
MLLTVEEMAVNELRETFHHWTRTLALPVHGETLGQALTYLGPHHGVAATAAPTDQFVARELWDALEEPVKVLLGQLRSLLSEHMRRELKAAFTQAHSHEKEAFEQRIREVAALQKAQSI